MIPKVIPFAAQDVEAAMRRGDAGEAVFWESFVAGPNGRPEDCVWLMALYEQLNVRPELRAVTEADFRERSCALWGADVDLHECRLDALAAREAYVSAVRFNSEQGLIRPGWITLPGDPPPRSPSPFPELEETA